MEAGLDDCQVLAVDQVDEAVFLDDPARPNANQHVTQWLRLADPPDWITQRLVDQPVQPLQDGTVSSQPIGVVRPPVRGAAVYPGTDSSQLCPQLGLAPWSWFAPADPTRAHILPVPNVDAFVRDSDLVTGTPSECTPTWNRVGAVDVFVTRTEAPYRDFDDTAVLASATVGFTRSVLAGDERSAPHERTRTPARCRRQPGRLPGRPRLTQVGDLAS